MGQKDEGTSFGPVQGRIRAMPKDVAFSLLTGFNYYAPAHENVTVFGERHPVYLHCQTGYSVYLARAEGPYKEPGFFAGKKIDAEELLTHWPGFFAVKKFDADEFLTHWRELIYRPMPPIHFEWPIDIASVDGSNYLVFPTRGSMAAEEHRPLEDYAPNRYALGASELASAARAREPRAAAIARSLLDAWDVMWRSGVLYLGLSGSSVWYSLLRNNVVLPFSWATAYVGGTWDTLTMQRSFSLYSHWYSHWSPDVSKVPDAPEEIIGISTDYIDPRAYRHLTLALDQRAIREGLIDVCWITPFTELFSLASLLFRLTVGRLPYQGSLIGGLPNGTAVDHKSWIDFYQRHPIFIFDPHDDSNAIGTRYGTASLEEYVENWNALPSAAREAFTAVFTQDFSDEHPDPAYLTPAEWRGVLFEGKEFDPARHGEVEKPRAYAAPGVSGDRASEGIASKAAHVARATRDLDGDRCGSAGADAGGSGKHPDVSAAAAQQGTTARNDASSEYEPSSIDDWVFALLWRYLTEDGFVSIATPGEKRREMQRLVNALSAVVIQKEKQEAIHGN